MSQDPGRGRNRRPVGMHTRYGPIARLLFRRFFGPVHFPEAAQEQLEDLARRGTIVYVMRSAGLLNVLYFNWAFVRRGLPLARVLLGLSTFLPRPLERLFKRFRPIATADTVAETVARGDAAMVFLRRPALLRSKGASIDDPFPKLVALQRQLDRPIFLVPQLLIFKRAPVRLRPGVTDVVLGSAEVPGRLHAFVSFLFNHKRSFVKMGRPIDLQQVLEAEPEASDKVIARKVRGSLGVGLNRELRAVVGPPLKPVDRLIEETLRDRLLRQELAHTAAQTGATEAEVVEGARKALWEISARYSPGFVDGANALARWVFNRIYDGVNVDEEGMARMAEASKRAPLVICPTHRSHVDYILISHVLLERGITPPLVAAGANLSFWPLGPLFRRGGAFFIRRSFKGDKIYGAALSAYVRKIARDGYTQEFYPEGGRTRTGRILQPKYGLIAMEVEAWIAGARDDLHFVPIAIDYARLIEAQSYVKELAGGEKRKEDIRGLLKTPAVLRSRWGQVHVQVDEPVSLAAFARERGFDPATATTEEKRDLTRALAHRIAYGMGRVQTITTTALAAAALLGHHKRASSAGELRVRMDLLREIARLRGARFSKLMQTASSHPAEPGAIHQAIELFASEGQVVIQTVEDETFYEVKEDGRSLLAFYRNNIVHHFEEEAIVAMALLARDGAASEALLRRVKFLSRLLKRELSFRPAPIASTVDATCRRMESLGLLQAGPTGWTVPPESIDALYFLRALLGDLVETYRVMVGSLDPLEKGPMERKDLVRHAFDHGKKVYLAGRVKNVEALSGPTMNQAIAWLVDQGHLVAVDDSKVALSEAWQERKVRAAFGKEIGRFAEGE